MRATHVLVEDLNENFLSTCWESSFHAKLKRQTDFCLSVGGVGDRVTDGNRFSICSAKGLAVSNTELEEQTVLLCLENVPSATGQQQAAVKIFLLIPQLFTFSHGDTGHRIGQNYNVLIKQVICRK